MATWLLKTEPSVYSFDDLVRDKKTAWDGVTNALALKHIREMKKGDDLIIYHTGDEKSAIGTATVTKPAYPNPKDEDPKHVIMDIAVGKRFKKPVSLPDIKTDPRFAGWVLLKIGRLSVVPVEASYEKALMDLAGN